MADAALVQDLISEQVTNRSAPVSPILTPVTNPIIPPLRVSDRMVNFSPEVYNLDPSSHLMRLMNVLVGSAGVGAQRKQQLVAQLQKTLQGSHFYDLDSFYGALFGVMRRSDELLDVNPLTDLATQDTWNIQSTKDASYKSRIQAFAQAIGYGASPVGMELMAEAILSVRCDVYESWVDADQGGTPALNRNIFTIVPYRQVSREEIYDVRRVLQRLKPANTIVVVHNGVDIHTPVAIRGVAADSEHWEVITQVTLVKTETAPAYPVDLSSGTAELPRPAFSGSQGAAWTYAADSSGVSTYTLDPVTGNVLATNVWDRWYWGSYWWDYVPWYSWLPVYWWWAGWLGWDGVVWSYPYGGRADAARSTGDGLLMGGMVPSQIGYYAPGQQPDLTNWFWATPARPQTDPTIEVIEHRFDDVRTVNHLEFDVAHYPQVVTVEYYDESVPGQVPVWRQAWTTSLNDSVPARVTFDSADRVHPFHPDDAHWYHCVVDLDDSISSRWRVTLKRAPGQPPVLQGWGAYGWYFGGWWDIAQQGQGVYSLGVRHLQVGYTVRRKPPVPPAPLPVVIATTTDVLGNQVSFAVRQEPAVNTINGSPQPWRCEPQPVGNAVVNFYVDVRTAEGAAQLIDRLFLDPMYVGPTMHIYTTEQAVEGDPDYSTLSWSPIARDYILQKGYFDLPPTAATFLRLEFTNLVAEPYENPLPLDRVIQLFPNTTPTGQSPGGASLPESGDRGVAVMQSLLGPAGNGIGFTDTPVTAPNGGGSVPSQGYLPTEALVAQDPQAQTALRQLASTLQYQQFQISPSAPQAAQEGPTNYTVSTITHSSKLAYFVGLKAVEAFRVDYTLPVDTPQYLDSMWDFLNWAALGTWNFNPNDLTTLDRADCVATSKVFESTHNVTAIQFATSQSDPIQLIPDDDFVDPHDDILTWDNDYEWHRYRDAEIAWSGLDNSVTITRQGTDGAGGIESPAVPTPLQGRIHAAVRLTPLTNLTAPLHLQIIGADESVLADLPITGTPGQTLEVYVGHTIGDLVPYQQVATQPRSLVDRLVHPVFAGTTALVWEPPPGGPSDAEVRVRLVQEGATHDSWKVDTLSLFAEALYWEFSNDGGGTWIPALDIRNNPRGVLTFPTSDNRLCWRVTGGAAHQHINAIQVRPWYEGTGAYRPVSGVLRGPNYSAYDNIPPIDEDPMFMVWSKPVPFWWFLASRSFPMLPAQGAPDITQYAKFFGRPGVDILTTPTDGASRFLLHGRFASDSIPEPLMAMLSRMVQRPVHPLRAGQIIPSADSATASVIRA